MTAPLLTFSTPAATSDLSLTDAGFAATTATVTAITDKGREFLGSIFGKGAVSVDLPKSKAVDFLRFAEQKGIATA
jgi:hypothetical protein